MSSASAACGANAAPPSRAASSKLFVVPFIVSSVGRPCWALLNIVPTPQDSRRGLAAKMRREPTPETEQAVGRREDDDEKDQADEGVEAVGAHHVDGEGLQEDIERGADERPDRDGAGRRSRR